jgi:hypothetical protein
VGISSEGVTVSQPRYLKATAAQVRHGESVLWRTVTP